MSAYITQLVNDPFGDPCLYVEMRHEQRAFLFDLGDISKLSPRQILRVSDVFVSHTHVDHFIGFDHFVRVCVGRARQVRFFGPPGIIASVAHKLAAYSWNLVDRFDGVLCFDVIEVHPEGRRYHGQMRSDQAFRLGRVTQLPDAEPADQLFADEWLMAHTALLDHHIPSLAFSLTEREHVEVHASGLAELGLPTGSWLATLKRAIRNNAAPSTLLRVQWSQDGEAHDELFPLYQLVQCVRRSRGHKLAYVTDAGFHRLNADRIVGLAHGADILFIETPFLHVDAQRAADRRHLTARQAGLLAAQAKVRRVVPFHFSTRHEDDADALERELQQAFTGRDD